MRFVATLARPLLFAAFFLLASAAQAQFGPPACDPSPCLNGGTCVTFPGGYVCTCAPGYSGTNCQIEIDECESNPCVNGICIDGVNSYSCACLPGWTGTNCDTDIDECASDPCLNGTCTDELNAYSCSCEPGWTGTNCDELIIVLDCSDAVADPGLLWPPNHQLVPISVLDVVDPDGGTVTITVTSVFQDELVNGTGDGDTSPDATGVGTAHASVRSERAGNGNGRVYHLSFSATSSNGGSCTGEVTVGVPKSQGKKGGPVDGGALYDSAEP